MMAVTGEPAGLGRAQRWVLALVLLVVVLFSALRFDGPTRGYWDTYIAVPAMFMAGQRVELLRVDGSPRFDYELVGRIPDDTYDPSPGGFGISSKDQRIGTAIAFGAPFALGNLAAFRWGYALAWGALFLFAFLSLRRILAGADDALGRPGLLRDFAIPLFGAALLVANPFSLYLDRLNGNLFGLVLLTFLFYLTLERRPPWWLIGLVFGLTGGVRNEAILSAPLLVLLLWHRSPDRRAFGRGFLSFGAMAFVGILPVLLWNQYAYGEMIIHPSQVAHLEGWRPTFPHRFLGSEFQFNGLLNWPFHDHIVRTPHFAFPAAMLWPLVTLRSFGLVLCALALLGLGTLLRRRRLLGVALLYWYLVYYGLFFFQENWEELKQTFMALHLFPLVAFMAAGLASLLRAARDWRRWAALAATVAVLAGAVTATRLVQAPADERWYHRFPHADRNEAGLTELPEERRKDWHFFYSRESAGEIERERTKLTRPCLLPRFYRPFAIDWEERLARIAAEPSQRELATLAIWSYIYE